MNLLKKGIYAAILALIVWGAVALGGKVVAAYNKSISLEIGLQKEMNARVVILDRVTKIIHQKLQIAKMNDSAYYKNLTAIAMMRQDGPMMAWKWVHEQNPNANYEEVSRFYADVSGAIDEHREELAMVEAACRETVQEYANLHHQFPTNLYLFYQ